VETDVSSNGPLDGIVVIDFTRIVSGPFATQILGDMGATVIKIERVPLGDDARPYGVMDEKSDGPGATFLALNRNKRSIALDLGKPEGRSVALRLLKMGDVSIHNFRPGVMERLGLDYPSIAADCPRLIYCGISGYGATGPSRESAANDLVIQAHSGLLGITGEPDGAPVRVPTPVADMTAGLYAVIGILAALHHRGETGRGQSIETNMLEGQVNMLNYMFVDYWLNGVLPQRMGTGNRMGLPNQAFPTSDGWICIVAANDRAWTMCCDALGDLGLAADPRFATLTLRYRNRDELVSEVASLTKQFTTSECRDRMSKAGVPCAPVNSIAEAADDPQLSALETITEMTVGALGPVKLVRSPLHFSETPITDRLPPPELGAHTDDILRELAMTQTEMDRLHADDAVR